MERTGAEAADYVSIRRGDPPSWESLSRLASDAGTETAVLSLFVTAEYTIVFIVRADWDALRVVKVHLSATRWEDAQRRLLREVAQFRGSSRLEQTWDSHLQPLLREVAPHIAGAVRVVVAPMGAAHAVAWNVLVERAEWHGPDGRPPAVVMLPALSMLPWLWRRRVHGPGPVLVVGNPRGDLRHAEQEADRVAAALTARAVLGPDATVERVLDDLGHASVAHLATHASFVRAAPLESGIVLADGVLTAAQVMRRRLQADLVVLSRCQTGVVDVDAGDELAGLAQAFLQAGARALIVSLWSVSDAATARLMTAFYEHTEQLPADRAAALRRAMDNVRAVKKWSHPYYWGAFTFIGAW